MAGETEAPIAAPAAAVPVPPAATAPPAVPVEAPVVEATPVVVPTAETPIAPEPAAAVAADALPTEKPTLLEQFDKSTEAKPAEEPASDAPKADEAKSAEPAADTPKTEEAKPVEAPPAPTSEPEPIKFDYKLPENFALPDEQREQINGALSDFARNPNSPDAQQKLVDFHNERLTEALEAKSREQHQTFADVRDRWVNEVKNDPIIGGGNHEPAMQAIAYVRDNFVSLEPRGSKAYERAKTEFDQFLHYTGAGDNPTFLRFLHNLSTVLNEPRPTAMADIKLIPQSDPSGRAPIYRHPTSTRNGR